VLQRKPALLTLPREGLGESIRERVVAGLGVIRSRSIRCGTAGKLIGWM
jgi:hypothetical protein